MSSLRKVIYVNAIIFAMFLTVNTTANESFSYELEACRVSLTEAGRRTTFSSNFIYQIQTDEIGVARNISREGNFDLQGMLHLDELESCIRRWKLAPNHNYFVVFGAGTTGDYLNEWFLKVCSPSGFCIKILLPRLAHHFE